MLLRKPTLKMEEEDSGLETFCGTQNAELLFYRVLQGSGLLFWSLSTRFHGCLNLSGRSTRCAWTICHYRWQTRWSSFTVMAVRCSALMEPLPANLSWDPSNILEIQEQTSCPQVRMSPVMIWVYVCDLKSYSRLEGWGWGISLMTGIRAGDLL